MKSSTAPKTRPAGFFLAILSRASSKRGRLFGRLVELGPKADVLSAPRHPTRSCCWPPCLAPPGGFAASGPSRPASRRTSPTCRRAASSATAASTPRTSAPSSSPSCRRSMTTTSRVATSRTRSSSNSRGRRGQLLIGAPNQAAASLPNRSRKIGLRRTKLAQRIRWRRRSTLHVTLSVSTRLGTSSPGPGYLRIVSTSRRRSSTSY